MILTIQLNSELENEFNELMSLGDYKGANELINDSLTLLEWAMAEEKSGRTIASIDQNKNTFESLRMPILDKIRNRLKEKEEKPKPNHLKVIK